MAIMRYETGLKDEKVVGEVSTDIQEEGSLRALQI